jgi:hypothetical protein
LFLAIVGCGRGSDTTSEPEFGRFEQHHIVDGLDDDLAAGALDALFAGPTATEQANGLQLVSSGVTGSETCTSKTASPTSR